MLKLGKKKGDPSADAAEAEAGAEGEEGAPKKKNMPKACPQHTRLA